MGSKLNIGDAIKSHDALKEYVKEYGQSSYRKVLVYKNGVIFHHLNNVRIIAVDSSSGSELNNIDIFWEDSGLPNYKMNGLFVRYSSWYCKIEFEKNLLTIYSDNSIKIIIS
ncbi:MAG TPA: hypothetical protein DC000_03440 [Clostridiales bacterium]|nr:hypothetical protein [Clostridiales bacterium]